MKKDDEKDEKGNSDEKNSAAPAAEEQQESGGGWGSWFSYVRKTAEQAVAICKRDFIEMTTQIRDDTTDAVESLFQPIYIFLFLFCCK